MPVSDGISSILVYFERMIKHISLVYYIIICITFFLLPFESVFTSHLNRAGSVNYSPERFLVFPELVTQER